MGNRSGSDVVVAEEIGNRESSRKLLGKRQEFISKIIDSGRPDAVAKQHRGGRMTARERIDALCDSDSYREIGDLVEPVRDTSFNADLVAPADGVVIGTAKLNGRHAMVTAHDFTVLGGSTGVVGADKTNRAVALATERGIPLVMLLEGGGHRIQDGQDSRHFAPTTGVFEGMARMSGWAPFVTAMMGVGFAGPTNYSSMADFVVMIRGQSTMGLAGPVLVKAGTGEEIDKESLGGAGVQADSNGLADLAVDSEAEVFEAIRKFLSYLPSNCREPLPVSETGGPSGGDAEDLLDIVPSNLRKPYDVRKVIEIIADKDSIFEMKPTFASNIVTSLARLNGRPVGFIANQPMKMAGMLDAKACEKSARFIAFCDAYGIPLVFLIDVPGFSIGSSAESSVLGRKSGRVFYELAHATVPRISIVMRKGYGAGYFAMAGGRSFDADACIAWPTAEICAMSVEGAVDVAYRRDYESADDPAARRQELIDIFKGQLGALRAAEHFGLDTIIDPRETRDFLIDTIAACPVRRQSKHPPKYRSISPI